MRDLWAMSQTAPGWLPTPRAMLGLSFDRRATSEPWGEFAVDACDAVGQKEFDAVTDNRCERKVHDTRLIR